MRRALVVFFVTVFLVIATIAGLYRYAIRYPDRPAEKPGAAVTLLIPRGAAFPKVVELLSEKRLIANKVAFRIFANYKGEASKVRAGTYKLETSITPRRLLNTLVHGVPAPTVRVTIPEGKNLFEVAEILAKARIAKRGALLREMRNVHFLRRIGVPGDDMEGFLFPDTYRFRTNRPAQFVLETLFAKHKRVFVRTRSRHIKRFDDLRRKLGWGHREVVILASIVEKETGRSFERPLISGVFLNRLTFPRFNPKLLQTDPTIVYGCTVPDEKSPACQRFKGRIRRIHLEDKENPYNTYTHTGLPPGPICNPGAAALEAVLAPKKSRYLYFVSKNDGTHYFSATREEHERAVDKYQRGIKSGS